ncbi:hypothetical protein QZQ38_09305 [Serratia marcescens]|uniref:hypothetical protein n=1 Tax=Serratia marcescens TaxID=615 RepID=UPI0027927530|nr:hypothetical protein [Serratia marcescens]MDP8748637.1 hypothetical protein [Serratia marcescens]
MKRKIIATLLFTGCLSQAHAGLVQVNNRVACYLAMDNTNKQLMQSDKMVAAEIYEYLGGELQRYGVDKESINENTIALENDLPRAYQQAAFADKCVAFYRKPSNRQ